MINKENLINKFKQIKDVVVSKRYLAVCFKMPFFSVKPELLLEVFEHLEDQGYIPITELGIDCNKFIFRKSRGESD